MNPWDSSLFHRNQIRVEENREGYKNEVEKVADELVYILKTELDDSRIIEIDHLENNLRDSEDMTMQRKYGKKPYFLAYIKQK